MHYIKLTSYNIQLQYISFMSLFSFQSLLPCASIITPTYLKYILDVQNQIKKEVFLNWKKKFFLTFLLNDVFLFVHFTFKALFPSSFALIDCIIEFHCLSSSSLNDYLVINQYSSLILYNLLHFTFIINNAIYNFCLK